MDVSEIKERLRRLQPTLSLWLESLHGETGRKAGMVGVDIDTEHVKTLVLAGNNTSFSVEHADEAVLPAGILSKDGVKDEAVLANILRECFKTANIHNKNVAFAIPRSSTLIKTINIDNRLKEEEIESRAWIEANRLFPDLVGDIYLDFTVSSQPTADDKNLSEMTLVACRKEQMKSYLETFKQAGLRVKKVDVNCYALERSLGLLLQGTSASQDPQSATALLNLNKQLSTFIVMSHQQLIHAQDQTYDGNRLLTQTSTYIKDHGISAGSSEVAEDTGYNDILKETLISHLRHTIHFFYSSRPNVTVKQIILSGECALVPHLAFFIQREMGLATTIAQPFANMQFAPQVNKEKLIQQGAPWMLACGLALS